MNSTYPYCKLLGRRLSVSSSSSSSLWRLTTTTRVAQPQRQACGYHTSTSLAAAAAVQERHGTTILCVRKNGHVCMMGDGMVSQGSIVVKPNAVKIRRILPKGVPSSSDDDDETKKNNNNNATLVGFAGSTADAFTLLERLETKLDEHPGQLARSCVELAKGWRTDKYLRRLEASLLVADPVDSFEITGNGDVLQSHDGVLGVGSGSPYAIGTCILCRFVFVLC